MTDFHLPVTAMRDNLKQLTMIIRIGIFGTLH